MADGTLQLSGRQGRARSESLPLRFAEEGALVVIKQKPRPERLAEATQRVCGRAGSFVPSLQVHTWRRPAAFSLLLLGGAQIPFLIASWKLRKLTRVVSSFRPCISSPEPSAVPVRTEVFQTHGRAGRDVSSEAVCSHTSPSQAMPLRPRGGNDWPIFSFFFLNCGRIHVTKLTTLAIFRWNEWVSTVRWHQAHSHCRVTVTAVPLQTEALRPRHRFPHPAFSPAPGAHHSTFCLRECDDSGHLM